MVERATDHLRPRLIEVVAFVDSPARACDLAEEGTGTTGRRRYGSVFLTARIVVFIIVLCGLGLPGENSAIAADSVDLRQCQRNAVGCNNGSLTVFASLEK